MNIVDHDIRSLIVTKSSVVDDELPFTRIDLMQDADITSNHSDNAKRDAEFD